MKVGSDAAEMYPTPPGSEESNGQYSSLGAVGQPGRSRRVVI